MAHYSTLDKVKHLDLRNVPGVVVVGLGVGGVIGIGMAAAGVKLRNSARQ